VMYAIATGGMASSTGGYAYARADASAYGIQSEETRGNMAGAINVIAIGGTASSMATGSPGSSDASAYAYGISDEIFVGDVTGSIIATAVGGRTTATAYPSAPSATDYADPDGATASSFAYGIHGNHVQISNFTGNISATAVAGLETVNVPDNEDPASVSADEEAEVVAFGGMTTVSSANAFGIYAEDSLYLNAPSGSIHAAIDVMNGYNAADLPDGSAACAICGGTGNDTIRLGNMDIVGDIDLRTGVNEIYLFGRTQVKGNVSATDGQNNYSFELYEDEASALNSKLMVDGTVSEPNGATVAAYAAAGQTAQNIVGNRYEVITAEDIAGTFVANDISMFDLAIEQSATNVVITATRVKGQTDASTRVSKTTVHTAQAVMKDLSAHSGAMRLLLRSTAAYGRAPNRPVGPAAEKLASGGWLVSVRQVNDLGSQDSDGALAGYDWQSSGFMAGAERQLNPNLVLGATAGGVWSDIDGKEGAGGGASDMFVAGLYGNWFTETLFVEAGFSYAHAWNEEQRIATDNQHYMGDYDSDLYGTWLEAGYTLSGKKCNVEPYFRTSYVSGNHDGYTDGGGTNPMKVNANNTDNWLTETGLRTSRNWELQNGDLFGIELKAAWQHELLDTSVSANASLLGTDQTLNSPASDRNALALGIKAEWKTSDAITLGVEYAPTVAGNWYNHYIAAALKYEF
ncbi:MAG: autotransporter outer membrane beta-barrel domain-containing protein, partial [Kiritimatiellales bacterium]|nr:autotransporter outer membrane beta-barrel domain-containing protein [Kiritimatiellales bacterium]